MDFAIYKLNEIFKFYFFLDSYLYLLKVNFINQQFNKIKILMI